MIQYRTFRNDDPPQLLALWNATFRGRGAAFLPRPSALEEHLFAKPSFDARGTWLAQVDDRLVGFGLSCMAPANGSNRGVEQDGLICLLGVHPEYRMRGIGAELLKRCESYLGQQGAQRILAGPAGELNPLTFGVHGGSDCPGFLKSEGEQLIPFFEKHGYQAALGHVVLQCDLEGGANVLDVRFFEHRQRYAVQTRPASSRRLPWNDVGALGPVEVEELFLLDTSGDEVVAALQWWEMELFGLTWGKPAVGLLHVEVGETMHRQGLARFLLSRFLQQAQDLCFQVAEAQVPRGNAAAISLFESVGFAAVDEGTCFVRDLISH